MNEPTGGGEATGRPTHRFLPGRRLVWYAVASLPLCLTEGGLLAAALFDLLLLLIAGVEARILAGSSLGVLRVVDPRLSLDADNRIALRLHNASPRWLRVTVRDDFPPGFAASPDEAMAELPPYARRTLHYSLSAPGRGRFSFANIHLRLESRAGLGAVIRTVPAAAEVRVYPALRATRRYDLAARLNSLYSVGLRSVRRAGSGGEFEQLREYVPGDPYRDLDWKSCARRHRPITRLYEQEQSQTVLLALDAGRMMAIRLGRITKLDHAINAALLLAYVALRKGDKVGLVVFADSIRTFVPPGRGRGQYRRILESLFAVQAEVTYVDFRRFTEFLQARVPRRSLLMMFSDLLDESQAMPLAQNAAILRRRHLPVCVTMDDPDTRRLAGAPADNPRQVFERAAACDVLIERETVKAHLLKSGVGLVEAPAPEIAAASVNRYLEIKARRAL
jgi:uncharacterized protein (DUF58 family)